MAFGKTRKKEEVEQETETAMGGAVSVMESSSFVLAVNDRDRVLACSREIIRQAKEARTSGSYPAAMDSAESLARTIEALIDSAQ